MSATNMTRAVFEAWMRADSTLPLDRDVHGYVDFTTALLWHTWQAAQKASAPGGALVGEVDANSRLGLAGSNSACLHDFALDPKSSILLCKHCGRSELAARSKVPASGAGEV